MAYIKFKQLKVFVDVRCAYSANDLSASDHVAGVTEALFYFRMTLAEGVVPRLGWVLLCGHRSLMGW